MVSELLVTWPVTAKECTLGTSFKWVNCMPKAQGSARAVTKTILANSKATKKEKKF